MKENDRPVEIPKDKPLLFFTDGQKRSLVPFNCSDALLCAFGVSPLCLKCETLEKVAAEAGIDMGKSLLTGFFSADQRFLAPGITVELEDLYYRPGRTPRIIR